MDAVENSLKLHALGIAISLESALSRIDLQKNIFSDIVDEGKWEGIAFISLYNEKGVTIMHSNADLINKVVDDDYIRQTISRRDSIYGYMTLATDENIFLLNFPAHIKNEFHILRVALHKYPFEEVIRQARLQAISTLIVIIILWIMGIFFIITLKKSETLNKAMEENQRLAMLGEMSSVLAHEIRTPLGSIKGFAQLAIEQGKNRENKLREIEEYLNIIIAESKRLESLTDDLLIYSKTAEYRIDSIDVSALIDECVKNITANNDLREIDLKVSKPENLIVKTDHDKLKQILINIIQNSVEAIDDKGIIKISASTRNNQVEILIEDNGCGMTEEVRASIFKPFFTTKANGTGLGLAIVERLMKSIGGQIEVNSEIGLGTKFRLILPKAL